MSLVQSYLWQWAQTKSVPRPTDLPTALETTKIGCAFDQVMMAIEMMFRGRYDCAVTLAGASESMIPKTDHSLFEMRMNMALPEELQSSFYANLNKKERVSFWNKQRDWLKHNGPTHSESMQITRFDAGEMIVRALSHIPDEWLKSRTMASENEALLQKFFRIWISDTGWHPPAEGKL